MYLKLLAKVFGGKMTPLEADRVFAAFRDKGKKEGSFPNEKLRKGSSTVSYSCGLAVCQDNVTTDLGK